MAVSNRVKRWEFVATAMLFLTLFAGFGLLYVAIPLGITFFCLSGMCFLGFIRPDRNLVASRITENNYV